MLKGWQYWLLTALGAVALVLTAANITLFSLNRDAQASVNARAQYLQQTGPIRELYQEMAKALAELSIKNHDAALEQLLAGEGFRINPGPAAAGGASKPGTKP